MVRRKERVEGSSRMDMDMDMEGIASIALLPCGSMSGHFIHRPDSACFALYGTEIACERECSRGEDYRLIRLTIFDYSTKRDQDVIVECRGQDAARFHNVEHAHGWEKNVMYMVEKSRERHSKLFVSFECETLKAEKDAEEHIKRYLPNLTGCDAVVNIGTMNIRGLNFGSQENPADENCTFFQEVESEETDAEFSITGSTTSCPSEHDVNCECSDYPAYGNSQREFNHSRFVGYSMQASSNPEEDMIRHLMVEELQAEGITVNIPGNKWEHSSSGWRIKNQVSSCIKE